MINVKDDGNYKWAIVGIVIGCVIILLILILVLRHQRRVKRRDSANKSKIKYSYVDKLPPVLRLDTQKTAIASENEKEIVIEVENLDKITDKNM